MFKVGQRVRRKPDAKFTSNWRRWKQQGGSDVVTVGWTSKVDMWGRQIFHAKDSGLTLQVEYFLPVVEDFNEMDYL